MRIYTHWWGGDVMAGPPRSWEQQIGLVRMAGDWRVNRLGAAIGEREEPNEVHGPRVSACNAGPRGDA